MSRYFDPELSSAINDLANLLRSKGVDPTATLAGIADGLRSAGIDASPPVPGPPRAACRRAIVRVVNAIEDVAKTADRSDRSDGAYLDRSNARDELLAALEGLL